MTHGSLFSGIGGFDLAADWMGWTNVFYCEWEDFPRKVLEYHFPGSISYGDITKTDFTVHRGGIDILTGGFPCQPYSAAGLRKGKEDDRHLWPEMLRAIREIQPRWVVGENVYGLVNWSGGLVFHEVQADLEAEGYEVTPFLLPACGVNAPHRRDRVWFVAYREGSISEGKLQQRQEEGEFGRCDSQRPTPDTKPKGLQGENRQRVDSTKQPTEHTTPDTGNTGSQGGKVRGSTTKGRKERNQQSAGCVQPNWQNFPTQPPVCSRDDGIPDRLDNITFPKWRNESIKAYGNAIVPQVAYQIFKAIDEYRNISHTSK